MKKITDNWLLVTGLLGLFGALMVGIGEFFLLYSPDGGHGIAEGYRNFLHRTPAQLTLGFYISAFTAPLYILGYWHVVNMLKLTKSWFRWVIMGVAVFGFMSGLSWLLTNAYLGIIVQTIAATDGAVAAAMTELLAKVDALSLPLLQVVRGTVMILSVFFVYFVLKGDTHYPKWMALFNPFVLILLVFSSILVIPEVAKYFVPEALNVAHFVFFATSSYFACHVKK